MLQEKNEELISRTEQIAENPCLDCETEDCDQRTADKMPKTLAELLQINNIEYIAELEQLKRFFDISKPDADGQPTIETEQKIVIITDNIIFNETYLIDVINEYLAENSDLVSAVKFVYVDKISIRNKLLAGNLLLIYPYDIDGEMVEGNFSLTKENGDYLGETSLHDFERTYLTPTIISINPLTGEISVTSEGLSTFTKEQIKKIFIDTKISE